MADRLEVTEEAARRARDKRPGGYSPSANGARNGHGNGSVAAKANGAAPALADPLTRHDMRRKRPPALSFLLRLATLRKLSRVVILLALDFAGVFAAIYTALGLKAAVRGQFDFQLTAEQTLDIVGFAYLVTALLFAGSRLYSARGLRPGLTRIIACLFQVTIVALAFAIINEEEFSSYYTFYGSLLFAVIYVSMLRWGYEKLSGALLRAAGYRRRSALVGSADHVAAVAQALGEESHEPVEVVGALANGGPAAPELPSLGTLDQLSEVLDHHRIEEVIVADPDFPQERAIDLIDQCHQRGVTVRVAPSTMEILVRSAEFVPGQAVPLFEVRPPVFDGINFAMKRAFDLVGATLLLIALSPLLAAIAGAISLTSRGGVLYRSVRPGIGGMPFACLKFRTMHRTADEMQADLESINEADGALFKIKDDPRLTWVGRLLRRFSLDELPQLINVLRGEMSLVGPRPLPQRDFDKLEDWHKKRYLVLPGITGLWQVSGRSELDFDELVRLDFLYLERWSVFLDLTILVKTVPAVISQRGAY